MLKNENALWGKRKPYPIEIWYNRQTIKISSCDELVEFFSDVFEELLKLSKNAKITDALYKFDESFDPVQLLDDRTEEMLMNYEFYKYNPKDAYNIVSSVWMQAYCIINKYQPRVF